jgi:hypothetical protein
MTGMTTYLLGGLGGINVIISPQTISPIYANVGYYQQFTAAGGTSPYTWALVGSLPSGLTLYSNGNVIGNATSTGSYSFGIKATDSATPQAHSSTNNYSGTVQNLAYSVSYTIVGGGGAGGYGVRGGDSGGGGGAGGVICGSFSFIYSGAATNTYKIVVGAGGGTAVKGQGHCSYVTYCSPSLSSFGNIVAYGGGYGGSYSPSSGNGTTCAANSGGSGGGGGVWTATPNAGYGSGASGSQGNSGGSGYYAGPSPGFSGGGGGGGVATSGGSGAPSSPSSPYNGGRGGSGNQYSKYSPFGAYVNPSLPISTAPGYGWLGAGGGGGGSQTNGGQGGGGYGGTGTGAAAAGAANSGAGGGGGSGVGPGGPATPGFSGAGGNGGGGVVFLTVPTQYYPGLAPGASVVSSSPAPGNTILAYTGTGTYKA